MLEKLFVTLSYNAVRLSCWSVSVCPLHAGKVLKAPTFPPYVAGTANPNHEKPPGIAPHKHESVLMPIVLRQTT